MISPSCPNDLITPPDLFLVHLSNMYCLYACAKVTPVTIDPAIVLCSWVGYGPLDNYG
jgi:hypothetical protein